MATCKAIAASSNHRRSTKTSIEPPLPVGGGLTPPVPQTVSRRHEHNVVAVHRLHQQKMNTSWRIPSLAPARPRGAARVAGDRRRGGPTSHAGAAWPPTVRAGFDAGRRLPRPQLVQRAVGRRSPRAQHRPVRPKTRRSPLAPACGYGSRALHILALRWLPATGSPPCWGSCAPAGWNLPVSLLASLLPLSRTLQELFKRRTAAGGDARVPSQSDLDSDYGDLRPLNGKSHTFGAQSYAHRPNQMICAVA